jgi:hypothetical protein
MFETFDRFILEYLIKTHSDKLKAGRIIFKTSFMQYTDRFRTFLAKNDRSVFENICFWQYKREFEAMLQMMPVQQL